jgi:2-dehydropantoate 2-reductase
VDAPLLVAGPGAVGLALAGRWALAGRRVALLARSAADERRLARGFTLELPDGSKRRVSKGLLSARALKSPAAAAFICVKAGDAPAAYAAARRRLAPDAPAVALQNGVGHEAAFRRAFGPARGVLGVAYFAADRPESGRVRLNGGQDAVLARGAANAAAVGEAKSLLEEAGWKVHLKPSEERMLWTKLVFNAAVNPLGAACAAESGALAEDPALRGLMLAALREAKAAAEAEGHALDYADMEERVLASCRAVPRQRNSMLQDLAAGRRTERRAILAPVLAAARRRGVPAPTLTLLDDCLARLERRLAR